MKIWPLPDDDFECMKVLGNILWNRLPDSKYKIMIRKHNLAIGGIIEDTNFVEGKFDSQYGKKLPWLKGFIPNNNGGFLLDDYEEPRNQKVASTGELRDTVILETPMFILCARNSQSLNDDDDNFTYEVSENDARQVMQMREFDSVQKIAISDLTDKAEEYRIISTNLRTQAVTYGKEMKSLQGKVNFLQQRNFDLEKQVSELYRQNKQLSTNKLRDESKMHMEEMSAEEKGAVQGMGKIELYQKAADDIKKLKGSMGSVDGDAEELVQRLRNENERLKKENVHLKERPEQENKKETPKPSAKEDET